MSGAPGFADWYQVQRNLMGSDVAMGFFVDLRNVSQKEEGAVSIIGAANLNGTWTYRFVDNKHMVPLDLRGKDVAFCCSRHLAKVALVILDFFRNFPHFSCPHLALTVDVMNKAGLKWEDIEKVVGIPSDYTGVAGIPDQEKLKILRRELEPLDIDAIVRMSIGDFRVGDQKLTFNQGRSGCLDCVLDNLSAAGRNPRSAVIKGVMQRIAEESQDK